MDLGVIALIAVGVGIVVAAVGLALRGRRTRSLPGDPHTSFHGERTNNEAAAGAYVADAVRDSGGL